MNASGHLKEKFEHELQLKEDWLITIMTVCSRGHTVCTCLISEEVEER
jgi:hypothetical protein